MHNIRVIIDNKIDKLYHQYNQIKQLLPKHSLYIYLKQNKNIEENVEYNIFFDVISENVLKLCPSNFNILLVNEEYIQNNKYLRREYYINKPLILQDDIVDYYFCLTLYSQNILLKIYKIKKNKIIYFNCMTENIYENKYLNLNNKKYILYDIDLYSAQNNLTILETWIKYFTNRPEYLIILYKYNKDVIVNYIQKLYYNTTYKNIILTDNMNIINSNIYASIINVSYYNLTTILYENIIRNRMIIMVCDNNKIIDNKLIKITRINKFTESNIEKSLNKLFKYTNNDINNIIINNKNTLINNIKKTKLKINKFFNVKNIKNIKNIKNNNIFSFTNTYINTDKNLETIIYSPSKIIEYHNKISSEMINIDKKFNKIINNNDIFNKYYRILKTPENKTEYAYATTLFLNNTYISSILATGYNMKYINKTKYNLICFIQDKPYYEDELLKFPGLTEEEINDIGKFYDCIIGIDLLKIQTDRTLSLHYTNGKYYATKLLCYGFIMYSKILYYDASTIIQQNIDYYMTKYNENKYYNTNNDNLHRGMVGNIYMFIPKIYYLHKTLYMLENYTKYCSKIYPFYMPDEDLLYYVIYPNWSNKQINCNEIQSNFKRIPYINILKKNVKHIYNFSLYVVLKPFLYGEIKNNTLFNSNYICYKVWDDAIKNIIKLYPSLIKYFEFIKTFRYTLF